MAVNARASATTPTTPGTIRPGLMSSMSMPMPPIVSRTNATLGLARMTQKTLQRRQLQLGDHYPGRVQRDVRTGNRDLHAVHLLQQLRHVCGYQVDDVFFERLGR